MKITIVHTLNIMHYPPVITLIRVLLEQGHTLYVIGNNAEKLAKDIKGHPNFHYVDIYMSGRKDVIGKISRRVFMASKVRKQTQKYMRHSDILWTTIDESVRCLGKMVYQYKHVMQLMELEQWMPRFGRMKIFPFPIDQYARRAWKVVVPEDNRAYIEKAWWNLKVKPMVLPNKPYDLEYGTLEGETTAAIEKLKHTDKKVILYLGIVSIERYLEEFACAIEELSDEYKLYIAGRVMTKEDADALDKMLKKYKNTEYLGFFNPPSHLALLKYTYIGLIPYFPNFDSKSVRSELNAMYCAPNKIYEYSGFGVPMLGTDVPGLKAPFEKYGMGICCERVEKNEIKNHIVKIAENHEKMSQNGKKFYADTDIRKIVTEILNEDEQRGETNR